MALNHPVVVTEPPIEAGSTTEGEMFTYGKEKTEELFLFFKRVTTSEDGEIMDERHLFIGISWSTKVVGLE